LDLAVRVYDWVITEAKGSKRGEGKKKGEQKSEKKSGKTKTNKIKQTQKGGVGASI